MSEDDMKRAFYGRGSENDLALSIPDQIKVSEQLFNECRGIMGTENSFEDMSLMNVIRHVIRSVKMDAKP